MKEIKIEIIIRPNHPELIEDADEMLQELKDDLKYSFPESTGFEIYSISVESND